MSTLQFNIIGAGRLGKNLAFSLVHHKLGTLLGICNSTLFSSQSAVLQLQAGLPLASIDHLPPSDMILITVPDDHIASIAAKLAHKNIIKPATTVLHFSGALNSEILHPLAQLGCYTASLHPFKAFSSEPLDPNAFLDCYCVVEGHPKALDRIALLFRSLKAQLITILPEKKPLYHAAAVMASNYLVTLAHTASNLLMQTGIEDTKAQTMIHSLMQSSLNTMAMKKIKDCLTGPLARGDIQTIKQHLSVLDIDTIKQFYCVAAKATLPLTGLDSKEQQDLVDLLNH